MKLTWIKKALKIHSPSEEMQKASMKIAAFVAVYVYETMKRIQAAMDSEQEKNK